MLHFLEVNDHVALRGITIDEFINLYSDIESNRSQITRRLSYVTVTHFEGFLGVYTSKDEHRRATILDIHRKGKVGSLRSIGSSAARNMRAAAATLWTDIDQANKWSPLPDSVPNWVDGEDAYPAGTGCPAYHSKITKALLAKNREDIAAGRGPSHAPSIYIEDFQQYLRKACILVYPTFPILLFYSTYQSRTHSPSCIVNLHRWWCVKLMQASSSSRS